MLSFFGSKLKELAVPDVPLVEDLDKHWTLVQEYYEFHDTTIASTPIEKTFIPFHLKQIIKVLHTEHDEKLSSNLSLGERPCIMYLLQMEVLDVLSKLAQADSPPGSRAQIFRTFSNLLSVFCSDEKIVSHPSICQPLSQLLLVICHTKASPTEGVEYQLVSLLAQHMLNLEIYSSKLFNFSENREDDSTEQSKSSSIGHFESGNLIVSALLNLTQTFDFDIQFKSMKDLLRFCSNSTVVHADDVLIYTNFLTILNDNLRTSFCSVFDAFNDSNLGPSLMVSMIYLIEQINLDWSDYQTFVAKSDEDLIVDKHEKHHQLLKTYFFWLNYCDSLMFESPESEIFMALAVHIKLNFFNSLKEYVMKPHDSMILAPVLACLARTWTFIKSSTLAKEFCDWMFNEKVLYEDLNVTIVEIIILHMKRDCNSHKSIVVESLHLFEMLLHRPCFPILENLVIKYLIDRKYYDDDNRCISSWSDEEDERHPPPTTTANHCDTEHSFKIKPTSKLSYATIYQFPSRTLSPNNIGSIVNAWLFIVPEFLRSNSSVAVNYTSEQKEPIVECLRTCQPFMWPHEAFESSISTPSPDSISKFGHSIEGPFLSAIFDLVETFDIRDSSLNLQITTCISKLVHLPHPNVHEFLLNTSIPLHLGVRSLFTSFNKVLKTISDDLVSIDDLPTKIAICKEAFSSSFVGDGGSDSRHSDIHNKKDDLGLTGNQIRQIDALIVVEEFARELASVCIVKFHLAANR